MSLAGLVGYDLSNRYRLWFSPKKPFGGCKPARTVVACAAAAAGAAAGAAAVACAAAVAPVDRRHSYTQLLWASSSEYRIFYCLWRGDNMLNRSHSYSWPISSWGGGCWGGCWGRRARTGSRHDLPYFNSNTR